MSKYSDSIKIADEVKSILDFDEYSVFSEFDLKILDEEDRRWEVSFRLMEIPLSLVVRVSGDDNSEKFEININEDTWEDFKSYDHTCSKPLMYLLFEVCEKLVRQKRNS